MNFHSAFGILFSDAYGTLVNNIPMQPIPLKITIAEQSVEAAVLKNYESS